MLPSASIWVQWGSLIAESMRSMRSFWINRSPSNILPSLMMRAFLISVFILKDYSNYSTWDLLQPYCLGIQLVLHGYRIYIPLLRKG